MLSPKKWARTTFERLTQTRQKAIDFTPTSGSRGPAEIQRWMQNKIGAELNVAGDSLDPTEPITSYGLDSIAAFTLTLDLSEWLERDLQASLLWDFPTISELARYLGEEPKA